MSDLRFSEDLIESLKSFDIFNNPSSWKIEEFANSLVLTLSWQKTKRVDFSFENIFSSSCGQENVVDRDEGKRIPKKESHQKRNKIKSFITGDEGAMNVESENQRTMERFVRDLEKDNGDPNIKETIQLIRTTESTDTGDTFSNCKLTGGTEDATHAACAQTLSSEDASTNQAKQIEIQNSNLENKLYPRCCSTICSKTAKCSCGKTFYVKEDAISHVMFNCPLSLCFRIELDIKVNRIIDKWKSEVARISGRKWWHLYKTSGFPSANISFPEHASDDIELVINEFIHNSCNKKLFDKNGNCFVLINGLKDLPSKTCLFS